MSDKSDIEWTDATWNPIRADNGRHICAKISPGCDHCYASTMTRRLTGAGYGMVGEPLAAEPILDEQVLQEPVRWKRPRKIFVESMSDLFGEWVPDAWLDRIFAAMYWSSRHTFQILTKRPRRMLGYLITAGLEERLSAAACQLCMEKDGQLCGFAGDDCNLEGVDLPLPNIWLGVTVENDAYTWRADVLREIPAAVRFLSCEPLLSDLPSLDLTGIHWVIVGGESGPGARLMHPDWARSLRDQCQAAGVAYFLKQWGEWAPFRPTDEKPSGRWHEWNGGIVSVRLGKRRAGRILDGRTWDEMPRP